MIGTLRHGCDDLPANQLLALPELAKLLRRPA